MNIALLTLQKISGRLLHTLFCFECFIFMQTSIQAGESIKAVGTSTNGINASIQYTSDSYGDGGHLVSIYVHFNLPSTNIEYISPFALEKYEVGKYYMATNSFCGPIELKRIKGEIIPLLKANVNATAAYPDSYSLQQVRMELGKRITMGPELPGVITGANPEECNFHLHHYFKIEKPGNYQLTIWPKIYKRSETNRDLCERIDLPPVSIPIKWTENSQ